MDVSLDCGNLSVFMIGDGTPIVLLHGLGCDHRLMAGCMEPVFQGRRGYRRIYVDLPGMGRSDALAKANSDEMLEALVALINRLGLVHFLLAGESYGGYLARGILSRMPERVAGLLFICPVAIAAHAARTVPAQGAQSFDRRFLAQLSPEEREHFCEYAVVANASTYKRYQGEIVPGAQEADRGFIRQLERAYPFSFDVDAKIRELQYERPVLLLTGRQDTYVGYRDQWNLLEDYPRATFSVLDMAGHNLQIERPEVFASLVTDWLERVEEDGWDD